MSPLARGGLGAMLAALALTLGAPREVTSDDRCKPNGRQCATNVSCCSARCMKPTVRHGRAVFGMCCSPTTCTAAGKNCGMIPDGDCGDLLNCGACTPPQTCGGGGTPNVCGCTPNCANKTCGDDGCGGSCGVCPAGQTCGGGGVPNQCGTTAPVCGDGFIEPPEECDGTSFDPSVLACTMLPGEAEPACTADCHCCALLACSASFFEVPCCPGYVCPLRIGSSQVTFCRKACQVDGDCNAGDFCFFGECRTPICSSDADCPGAFCFFGVCCVELGEFGIYCG